MNSPYQQMSMVQHSRLLKSFGATRMKVYTLESFLEQCAERNTTYIAEGDFGIWEVTPDGQVAWQFSYGEEKVWRTYVHYADDPEIVALLKA